GASLERVPPGCRDDRCHLFCPLCESPRHLLEIGRTEGAARVMAELNGVPVDDPLVLESMEELQFAINENAGGKATWAECFSTRNSLWKRTVNGMMLQFIQQLNGQNFYCMNLSFAAHMTFMSVLADYYGDTFFKSAGTKYISVHVQGVYLLLASSVSPFVLQTILGGVSVAGTIPALVRALQPIPIRVEILTRSDLDLYRGYPVLKFPTRLGADVM
ncbi:hypothetical protein B0H10DRAFT_2368759, partial [Mycena sp. CBHHK59/15]